MGRDERRADWNNDGTRDRRMPTWWCWLAAAAALSVAASAGPTGHPAAARTQDAGASAPALRPTEHPPVPATLDEYWLAPPATWQPPASAAVRRAMADLATAFARIKEEQYAAALPLINVTALAGTPLEGWASYAKGRAELGLKQAVSAQKTFLALRGRAKSGPLALAAAIGQAEALAAGDLHSAAAAVYRELVDSKAGDLPDLLGRLARTASDAGDRPAAAAAWERLYFEFPATDQGKEAARTLAKTTRPALAPGSPRARREAERAEMLFARRQYTDARTAFAALAQVETGERAQQARLRVAQCDYHLRRYRQAAQALRPMAGTTARGIEAGYYYLSAVRGTGQHAQYVKLARQFVAQHADSTWAERALDELGSHYIIIDEDAKAADIFAEVLKRYPTKDVSQRAAWKAGWWAYRQRRFADAASIFEQGAAQFPRSNYRPSFLYWSAQARERLGERDVAVARYRLTVTDYGNLYYGRQAEQRITGLGAAVRTAPAAGRFVGPVAPAREAASGLDTDLLGWLVRAGLHEQAIAELDDVRRRTGPNRVIDTTRAWLYSQAGDRRTGISLMRQAYPHFMADGGESLPDEILKVIYPLDYWPLITKYAAAQKLDPYLIAALMAQESAFDPKIRSSAGAVGLMQLMPGTARLWARKLGIRYSASRLTDPEFSVRVGTAYFAELMKRFGGEHLALAAYNAGEHRVAPWKAERPGLPVDEFIDDIPFPETQNYVKRILGTAEDYRRLYGGK